MCWRITYSCWRRQLCLPYLKIKAALVAVSRATARSLMKIEIKEYKKVSTYSGVSLVFILVGILISGPLLKKTEIAIALAILVLPLAIVAYYLQSRSLCKVACPTCGKNLKRLESDDSTSGNFRFHCPDCGETFTSDAGASSSC